MLAIVILNYNSAEDAIKCIYSIERNTTVYYNIFLIDGGSNDNSFDRLRNHFESKKNIKIIKSEFNGGYSYGNNIGIKAALKDGAKYILIINPDVILLNNAIDILYQQITKNPEIKVIGPSILSMAKEEQQFARKKLTFNTFVFDKKPFFWIKRYLPFISNRKIDWTSEYSSFSFMGMISGCCFLIDSNLFSKVGLFDENVFLFGEEDILAYKLEKENINVNINPNAKVRHVESSSISKKGNAFSRYHRTKSALYVLKYYARLNRFQRLLAFFYSMTPFVMIALLYRSYRPFVKKIPKQFVEYFKNI